MKSIQSIILIVLVSLLAGCVALVKKNIPDSTLIPRNINSADKAEMTYSITIHNPPPSESGWHITKSTLSCDIRNYFTASGYFTQVRESTDSSPFHVDFVVTMNPSPNALGASFIAGSTLGLIPVWCTHEMELTATVFSLGEKHSTFCNREEVLYVGWVPLWPVALFKNDAAAKAQIGRNYCHALLSQMEMKKLLPIPKHRQIPLFGKDHEQEKFDVVDYDFNAATRKGFISINISKTGIGIREQVIKKIGHICSSSNISLAAGEEELTEGGRYQILSEKIENNILTITFQAVY